MNGQGGLPDILTHATDLSNADAGNALFRAMPFLFERIDDDTELLPDNLLRSDSVIAKLVEAIPEEDWAEVEVIGWLYQFYSSEEKDQVIGKVVKSQDIPAAIQIFTPNWIVQYLVQNSVGRLWLMANPQSTLVQQWPYYITPAEQTPEVQVQLDALIQTRVREDGDTLNPDPPPCWIRPVAAATFWWWPTTCLRPCTWSVAIIREYGAAYLVLCLACTGAPSKQAHRPDGAKGDTRVGTASGDPASPAGPAEHRGDILRSRELGYWPARSGTSSKRSVTRCSTWYTANHTTLFTSSVYGRSTR